MEDWAGWAQVKEDYELTIEDLYFVYNQEKYKLTVGSHYTGVGNYLLWDQLATGNYSEYQDTIGHHVKLFENE